MEQEILKLNDVAELLQLSPRQVMNMCKEDANTPIPHIKVNGRSLRFRASDVNAWLNKNTKNAISV
jgi:predicted DNA-binding transcriptional regulator AlpA